MNTKNTHAINLLDEIRYDSCYNKFVNVDYLKEWLSKSPRYTTFRINKLRTSFDVGILNNFLANQKIELNLDKKPNMYLLKPDCLVIEQWPNVDYGHTETKGREVVVDSLCAAAVLRGAHVYAPGVMGLPNSIKINDMVEVYGDLEGQCKKGLKVLYEGKKLFVGRGYLKMSRRNLFENSVQPSGIAVQILMPASNLPVVNESIYEKGQVILQNLPSIVCGWVVNAQAGDHILDMCASPGNKTTHMAEMSNNQAYIIAIDKTPSKMEKIKERCMAHGITCVHNYVYDSTLGFSENSKGIFDGPPFPENSFDKILLDAPCSGLGQRPQLRNRMTPKMLKSYKYVQRKLITTALKLLKVGGTLTYSTCTVTQDENEGNVAWALEKYPHLKLIPAEPLLGGPGWSDCRLTHEQRLKVQRFGPEKDEIRNVEDIYRDTIGFFIAKFTKIRQGF